MTMKKLNRLPSDARIWIYAADRILNASEIEIVQKRTTNFVESWVSHNVRVDAAFELIHDCFLIIGVDEANSDLGGCGIDKSLAFVKELGQELNINFLNRMQIEVLENNKLHITGKQALLEAIQRGEISQNATTFNKTIIRLSDLAANFSIPLTSAWFWPKTELAL